MYCIRIGQHNCRHATQECSLQVPWAEYGGLRRQYERDLSARRMEGKTFAEASMLVHQMVYHFQNLAGLKYECSWERESLAYAAQEQWLRLHETNLGESFGIDRTIFLLSSEYIC